MSKLPFRIIPWAERVSIAPCPINHYREEGEDGSGQPEAQRGRPDFHRHTLAERKPMPPGGQGSLTVPWISTQTPPLTLVSPADPPLFPHGPAVAPLWFLNKTKGQSASWPVSAVISLPVRDSSSLFMMDPNFCLLAANWMTDEQSFRWDVKGSSHNDMVERVCQWHKRPVLWATGGYCCHCLSVRLSVLAPLPPPGLEAPHRLSTRLHISQMLHPPTALLLFSSAPLHPPICYPAYVEGQINNPLHLSFPSNLLLFSCLSTCCSPCSGQTRLGYPPQSQSRGLGMRGWWPEVTGPLLG